MLKSILAGGAMLLAIPALAQTGGTNANASQTGTTTNDHGSMHGSQDSQGTRTSTTGSQVNGGVTSSSPGTGTASGQGNGWSGSAGTGMATGGGTIGSGTSAGAGGPYQAARSYPPCTRTRTDSCRQRGGR